MIRDPSDLAWSNLLKVVSDLETTNMTRGEDKDTKEDVRNPVDIPFELWCPMNPLHNNTFHHSSAVKHFTLVTLLLMEIIIGGSTFLHSKHISI